MLKAVGGSVWPELKGTDSKKRPLLMDEGRVPDFFDQWMEEYTFKVEADQPGTGQQPKHRDKTEADEKDKR